MMARYRSILAWLLAVVATFTISCSSATAAITSASSYTADQIQQIQGYVSAIEKQRDRMSELQTLIQKQRWVDVGTFIHGPLGELRTDLNRLAFKLKPQDKAKATQITKDLYGDLVRIGQAANQGKSQAAISNFRAALQEFDAFLQLVPNS